MAGRELEQGVHQLKTVWSMCKDAVAKCQNIGFEPDELALILRIPQPILEELLRLWGLGG